MGTCYANENSNNFERKLHDFEISLCRFLAIFARGSKIKNNLI